MTYAEYSRLSLPFVKGKNVFAHNGDKTPIPATADASNSVNYSTGFTPAYSTVGGKYVSRNEINSLFGMASVAPLLMQCGMRNTFNESVCSAIGGYPKGAILCYYTDNGPVLLESTIDDNENNFIEDGIGATGWKEFTLGNSGSSAMVPPTYITDTSVSASVIVNANVSSVSYNSRSWIGEEKVVNGSTWLYTGGFTAHPLMMLWVVIGRSGQSLPTNPPDFSNNDCKVINITTGNDIGSMAPIPLSSGNHVRYGITGMGNGIVGRTISAYLDASYTSAFPTSS